MAQKIRPQNREGDGGEEECPLSGFTADGDVEGLLSPARYGAAISTGQTGSRRRETGLPRHNGEGRTGVDQETAVGGAICHVEEAAGTYRRRHAPAV